MSLILCESFLTIANFRVEKLKNELWPMDGDVIRDDIQIKRLLGEIQM